MGGITPGRPGGSHLHSPPSPVLYNFEFFSLPFNPTLGKVMSGTFEETKGRPDSPILMNFRKEKKLNKIVADFLYSEWPFWS